MLSIDVAGDRRDKKIVLRGGTTTKLEDGTEFPVGHFWTSGGTTTPVSTAEDN